MFVQKAGLLTVRQFYQYFAGCAILLVTGCALEPEAVDRPAPHMSGSWRAAKSGHASAVSRTWPTQFGSRELSALSRQALDGNFDLDAAAARILQASAQAGIAAAALYPQIEGAGSGSRTLTPGTLRSSSPPFQSSVSNNFRLGLSVDYALDFWGRNARLVQAGKLSAIASQFDYDVVALTTLVSLSNTYFQILLAQERLRIARSNIRTATQTLAAIKARVEVGTNTALDVAQQESIVANLRANIPVLEQQLQQNRNIAAVLLGRTPQSVRIKGGSLHRLRLPRIRPGLPSQLLLRRPDIAAGEARLKAAGASIVAARAALYPTISLTGNTSLASQALRNLLRPEAIGLGIASSAVQSIFSGYNLENQVELSRANRLELLANYRKSIITALSEVENALIAIRKTAEQERLRAVAVKSARRAFEITGQRLREGTIDVVTLLSTQQTLFSAQDALTVARGQRLQAAVSLFQALGGGFTMDPKKLLETAPPKNHPFNFGPFSFNAIEPGAAAAAAP